jgi:pre-rRNA-processing protein TSR1
MPPSVVLYVGAGRHVIASMYAPISYGPLPFLAFKVMSPEQKTDLGTGLGTLTLAATGALRGSDPDRIVLKKITLTGKYVFFLMNPLD